MVKKNPNPIDIHVGARLRMRRVLQGMSQENLGERLDLTFQQVQKYEKGANRVSASRLYQIGEILRVPVEFFFDGLPDPSTLGNSEGAAGGFSESFSEAPLMDFLSSSEGIQLNKAFAEIRGSEVRRKLIELARAIAAQQNASSDDFK